MIDKSKANPKIFARLGYAIIIVIFGGIGGWAATARLDSAVIAPGQVVLENNRRAVQHLEGGIVSRIHVQEGDIVQEGDLLIEMDRVAAHGNLEVLIVRRNMARTLEARFVAERNLLEEVVFPQDLLESENPQVISAIDDQTAAFESRRLILDSQRSVFQTRIDQLAAQIEGLELQRRAIERRLVLQGELLDRYREGEESGVLERNNLVQLEDSYIQLEAQLGGIMSDIARIGLQQNEAAMQIIQAEREYREGASNPLDAVRQELAELNERIVIAEDVLGRTYVRASETGTVQSLSVHTEGAVVSQGAMLMEIVPENDRFIISANIPPQYIDSMATGLLAEVRFTAITDQIPEIAQGEVITISRDVIRPQEASQPPYYLARITIDEENVPESIWNRVTAGMPVSVIINTGERTVLNYLVEPVVEAVRTGMREE
jgi:HlyD family secretion protein